MNIFKYVIATVVLLATVSCNRVEEDFTPREDCPNWTDSQIDSIGVIHNDFLEKVYLPTIQSGYKDPAKLRELTKFMAAQYPVEGLSVGQKDSLIAYSDNVYDRIYNQTNSTLQYNNWVGHPFSNNLMVYLTALQNQANNAESYTQYVSAVNNLVSKAVRDTSLSCKELQTVKVTASVAKNSAYVWMPTWMGGLGWYDTYGAPVVQGKKKWSWTNALGGDLAAASVMCFEVAIAGAMTGGIALAPTAVVGAVSCGLSSAYAGAGIP